VILLIWFYVLIIRWWEL